ncbi:hypothetical protein BZA77DRAFT_21284 [Pyronema omphalodes]|nr:hypothetical protein BZA77DRAFT_21284 [Pyronema omphalodes]
MSEGNPYSSHLAVSSIHYSISSQTNGGIPTGASPQPGQQALRFRGDNPEFAYNMNGIAGGPQTNHSYSFQHGGNMPAVPRGPPPPGHPQQWKIERPEIDSLGRHINHEPSQHGTLGYPSAEMAGSWSSTQPSFVRSQQSASFPHPHTMAGHSPNYNMHSHPQYTHSTHRSMHTPLEPSAAPSPPNPYPDSPRTPISAHQTVATNGIPATQPFRQPNNTRSSISGATSDGVPYRQDTISNHGGGYPESGQSSPSTYPLIARRERGSMASPLAPPPVNQPPNYVENISHLSYRRNSDSYPHPDDRKTIELKLSRGKPVSYGQPEHVSDEESRIKRETRSPSTSISPGNARMDLSDDRSPSFTGSTGKDSKPRLDLTGKKKGQPVFTGSDGVTYYENEFVPPNIAVPEGWQIGTGKQTMNLLLPKMKDGIQVNPEWGFTAGGKARQRLPQACKNCRAKKIRCMESDYDESKCQHCTKMQIHCVRYEK